MSKEPCPARSRQPGLSARVCAGGKHSELLRSCGQGLPTRRQTPAPKASGHKRRRQTPSRGRKEHGGGAGEQQSPDSTPGDREEAVIFQHVFYFRAGGHPCPAGGACGWCKSACPAVLARRPGGKRGCHLSASLTGSAPAGSHLFMAAASGFPT